MRWEVGSGIKGFPSVSAPQPPAHPPSPPRTAKDGVRRRQVAAGLAEAVVRRVGARAAGMAGSVDDGIAAAATRRAVGGEVNTADHHADGAVGHGVGVLTRGAAGEHARRGRALHVQSPALRSARAGIPKHGVAGGQVAGGLVQAARLRPSQRGGGRAGALDEGAAGPSEAPIVSKVDRADRLARSAAHSGQRILAD